MNKSKQSSNRKKQPIGETTEYRAYSFARTKAKKNGWRFPFENFDAFIAHCHERPSGNHCLERVSDGVYRWTERKPNPETDPQAFLRYVVRCLLDQEKVHGLMEHFPQRDAFNHARARCTRPSDKSWRWYGELGVHFKFKNLKEWCIELGPRPSPEYSVDRVDPSGHYEHGGIRYATPKEQAANKRKPQRRSNGK